jgi:hypothetical protein
VTTFKNEKMFCVGGPLDGQTVTTSLGCVTMQRDTIADPDSGTCLIRNVYKRERDGMLDIWRFKSSTAMQIQ